ncbi:MAG: D-tyrosyl-tRNA(Tyr) deacylase [Flavobacteriales bacterium]|nr:D-tyrosyl-tRNA(Tyr) deacylase [Flavobacteriales bacterium]
MRALIQRTQSANVVIEGKTVASIDQGLLILLGIEEADTEEDSNWLAKKCVDLRIFNDDDGKMNRSVLDVEGNIIVVSQFTLHAKTKKGTRPSFIHAAKPDQAIPLYEHFKESLSTVLGKDVQSGEFGADMKVGLVNDGPVTIWIDTKNKE